jgi:hypothetical protein
MTWTVCCAVFEQLAGQYAGSPVGAKWAFLRHECDGNVH